MSATEYVVLVDAHNQATGMAEKLLAHQQNLMHRAFSVFIFKKIAHGLMLLLQQRAAQKYHCPELWTNTCCSHPRANETVLAAGKRRLQEELGFSTELTDIGWFHYNAHFDNGLSENEIDHVLIGVIDDTIAIHPNPEEVQAYRWVEVEQIDQEITANPTAYTPWLPLALKLVAKHLLGSDC